MPTPTLPSIGLVKSGLRALDVLVVGLSDAGPVGVPADLDTAYAKAFGMGVGSMAEHLGARPAAGTTRTLPAAGRGPRVVIVGLGTGTPTAEDLRRAAGTGTRHCAELAGGGTIAVGLSLGANEADTVQAVAEGALLGCYRYASPGRAGNESSGRITRLAVVTTARLPERIVEEAAIVAGAVAVAREWVNVPPNVLYPAVLAESAGDLLQDTRVEVEILDEKALARGGYGGILAVGGGSSRPPRLLRMSYRPRGASRHLGLVGKGITFDSGGLNLKPGDGMYTMKCDMAGAAAVITAVHAIARLGLKVAVTAYASIAENLPSDTAYRPSDVLTMYGGKTVENGNTDAEGRLVMADALARASQDGPDLLVDVATLTGACVVALGDRTAGLMASDDDAAARILDAAATAGEEMWRLPMPKETRGKLDSKVADLKSTGDRTGGALTAAAFLREFVGDGIAWGHLDIAGPAFVDGAPYGYVSSGGTGFGVRTLVALARGLAS